MEKAYTFHASAHLLGKSKAYVAAEAVPLALQFSAPPEFNGERGKWTPEHLLVAATSSCLAATFRSMAEHSKFEFISLHVEAEGTLEKLEDGFRFTRIVLRPRLAVIRDDGRDRAVKLLQKAERACLVTRSLQCQVTLDPLILVQAADEIVLPVPAY
jgi:Predicted redox protein, regulator of disulfide bond formation